MKIFLDMDGVLVNMLDSIMEFHNKRILNWPKGCYNLAAPFDMTKAEIFDPLDQDFWANLPWTCDGRDILDTCIAVVGIYNICLITEPTHSASANGKIQWIKREIPGIDYIITNKKAHCAGPRNILIDDCDTNIDEWDGPSILVPKVWNSEHVRSDIINIPALICQKLMECEILFKEPQDGQRKV